MRYRKGSAEEQLKAWHALAFEIHLHRTITLNEAKVIECVQRIHSWVDAHSDHNGERPDRDIDQNVNAAFWKFIASNPEAGIDHRSKD